jgi:hypothetical protein
VIRGFVGRGGAGKTFSAVSYLWSLYKRGRAVYSTTPLVDLRVKWSPVLEMYVPVDALHFGLDWAAGYLTRFDEIYGLDNCEVFLDEVGGWMDAKDHSTIPDEVRRFLAQDRREGVNINWTHRTTRVFHYLLDNTAEVSRSTRYGPLIWSKVFDPQDPKEQHNRFTVVSPKVYDLYQTLARVGDSKGNGYGLGGRAGYRSGGANGKLVRLDNWGPHGISIFCRPEQYNCLLRKFGPEAVGLHRDDNAGRGLYRYGPCEWLSHITEQVLIQKRGY